MGIYNISRCGYYHADFNLWDLQGTLDSLQKYTDEVAKRCPFAYTFGVDGKGEGVVWKMTASEKMLNDPFLWVKIKAGDFAVTTKKIRDPAAQKAFEEKKGKAAVMALDTVTENRLEQGWDYMREMEMERTTKNIAEFLKWLSNDILVEEKATIEEQAIDEKVLRGEIAKIGREWYLGKLSVEPV